MTNKKYSGLLIALEGGEGAGKTTQVAKLVEKLRQKGKQVVTVREPGGTEIGEQIRSVVLRKENVKMADTTEVLLYQASRAQVYAEVIIPALEKGMVVIMDRTSDSSLVYQGMVRGMGVELIRMFNLFSTQQVEPDLIILLDVSAEIGLSRLDQSKRDRLESESLSFHERVRNGYLQLVSEDQNNKWQVVDAQVTLEKVEEKIWEIVMKKFYE